MAIPEPCRRNFQTLLNAAADGNLALMECSDVTSGVQHYVVVAAGYSDGDYIVTPFCHLNDGNPYDAYHPPVDEGTSLQ